MATEPDRPTIETIRWTDTSLTFSFGEEGSYGDPSTGTTYLYVGTTSEPTTVYAQKSGTGLAEYTVTGLTPNTQYYFRAGAFNGQLWKYSNSSRATDTLLVTPVVKITKITKNSVTFNYLSPAQGEEISAPRLEYSLSEGTWTYLATVIEYDKDTSGTKTISNLTPGREYTLYVRSSSNRMGSISTSKTTKLQFKTLGSKKLFGSASGRTKQVVDLYGRGSVAASSQNAKKITRLYGPVEETESSTITEIRSGQAGNISSFNLSTFMDKTENLTKLKSFAIESLKLTCNAASGYPWTMYANFSDGTSSQRLLNGTQQRYLVPYGITASPTTSGDDYIDFSTQTTTSTKTKLIHQGFGHLSYN